MAISAISFLTPPAARKSKSLAMYTPLSNRQAQISKETLLVSRRGSEGNTASTKEVIERRYIRGYAAAGLKMMCSRTDNLHNPNHTLNNNCPLSSISHLVSRASLMFPCLSSRIVSRRLMGVYGTFLHVASYTVQKTQFFSVVRAYFVGWSDWRTTIMRSQKILSIIRRLRLIILVIGTCHNSMT